MPRKKNAAAVALGRLGGKARRKKMSPEHRKAVAQQAARARWTKEKEKTAAKVKGLV